MKESDFFSRTERGGKSSQTKGKEGETKIKSSQIRSWRRKREGRREKCFEMEILWY